MAKRPPAAKGRHPKVELDDGEDHFPPWSGDWYIAAEKDPDEID